MTFEIKSLYFFMFAGFGVLSPYLPVFFEVLMMSKTQIGILSMLTPFSSFLFAPFWSFLCDKLDVHNEMMILSIIFSTIAFQLIEYSNSFIIIFVLVSLGSFFRAPLTPLLDSMVISSLADKSQYGSMRLWGAVSFGIFSLLGGVLTSSYTLNRSSFFWLFLLSGITFCISGFIILHFIHTIHMKEDEKLSISTSMESMESVVELTINSDENLINSPQSDSQLQQSQQLLSQNLSSAVWKKFTSDYSVAIFAIIVLLSGIGSGVIEAFLFLRIRQLGGNGIIMGIGRFITCAAEVPMFQIAGYLKDRLGTWKLLAITQLAFIIRFIYYINLTKPWYVLPCELLNGITFAITWSVSCSYANDIAPPGTQAFCQSILEGLHFGLGSALGALIGGIIYDYYGAIILFQSCAVMSCLSFILALIKAFIWDNNNSNNSNNNNKKKVIILSETKIIKYENVNMLSNNENEELDENETDNEQQV